MVPTRQDLRDAVQMFSYYLGFAKERPQFGRFSYLEKFDYWAVFWGIAMIILWWRGDSFWKQWAVVIFAGISVLAALEPGRPFDLLEDLRSRSCRAEAISAILAVLELARLSLVRIHQGASGEISLYRTTRELAAHDLETIEG